jgi:hypothetical protein
MPEDSGLGPHAATICPGGGRLPSERSVLIHPQLDRPDRVVVVDGYGTLGDNVGDAVLNTR